MQSKEPLTKKALSICLDESDKEFALKLYRDLNSIVTKCLLYSSTHNNIYFNYDIPEIG